MPQTQVIFFQEAGHNVPVRDFQGRHVAILAHMITKEDVVQRLYREPGKTHISPKGIAMPQTTDALKILESMTGSDETPGPGSHGRR